MEEKKKTSWAFSDVLPPPPASHPKLQPNKSQSWQFSVLGDPKTKNKPPQQQEEEVEGLVAPPPFLPTMRNTNTPPTTAAASSSSSSGLKMYPNDVKAMTLIEKQNLVAKITRLPSQYLRGLIEVISRYQPPCSNASYLEEEYDLDLAQMKENTIWAIHDFVRDSMVELESYVKQTLPNYLPPNYVVDDPVTSIPNKPSSQSVDNSSQEKFIEQVHMYSQPKIYKTKVKPSKKHECPTCQKQFRGKSELQNHIRTHTGEKPLVCSFEGCNKRYAHSSNLRAHERTHLGIKPYVCHYDGCGKSFAHSVSLKEHIWMHAGVQPYECPFPGCNRKFTQVSNFARHKKIHEKKDTPTSMTGSSTPVKKQRVSA